MFIELPYTELLDLYEEQTGHHSVPGPMRHQWSYRKIFDIGEPILPAIFEHIRDFGGGMNTMLLLSDITGQEPNYKPDPITNKIASYNVDTYRTAWLDWGEEKGYIQKGKPRAPLQ